MWIATGHVFIKTPVYVHIVYIVSIVYMMMSSCWFRTFLGTLYTCKGSHLCGYLDVQLSNCWVRTSLGTLYIWEASNMCGYFDVELDNFFV